MSHKSTDLHDLTDIIFYKKKSIADMESNPILDFIVWCSFANKKLRVTSCKKNAKTFKLAQTPNVRIDRFISVNAPMFFNPIANPDKLEAMYMRLTNQMSALDNDMIHKMFKGNITWDKEAVTRYAGDRKISIGEFIEDVLILEEKDRFKRPARKKPKKVPKRNSKDLDEALEDIPASIIDLG